MTYFSRINAIALTVALVITLVTAGISFITLNDYGIVWDEPIYFANGDKHWDWYKAPRISNIQGFFGIDQQADVHPPLRKLLAGMTHDFLTNTFHMVNNTRGYRISGLLFLVPFVSFYTYYVVSRFGLVAGIITSSLMFFHPAVFALANLVTLDYAVMTVWFGIGAILLSAITPARAAAVGILLGISLLIKAHGLVFALAVGVWWIIGLILKRFKLKAYHPISFRYLLLIFAVGITILIAGWPLLWSDPVDEYINYLQIQNRHPGVYSQFFGTVSKSPPFWYAPFMIFATMPVGSATLILLGLITAISAKKPAVYSLIYFSFFPIIFFMLPGVFRYDMVRLFLPALPFLYLFISYFVKWLLDLVKSRTANSLLASIIILYSAWVIVGSTVYYHPNELSYYNEALGGIAGAYRLGMDTEIWGWSFKDILPYMNERKGTMFCVFPTTAPFYYYQAMGQLEGGVIFEAGRGACTYLVVLMRRSMFPTDTLVQRLVDTSKPEYSVSFQDVPLVSVYKILDL